MGPMKLIELDDGTYIQVDALPGEPEEVAASLAERVSSSFEKLAPVLMGVCDPFIDIWRELNAKVSMQQAELEIGLAFEGEGNLYITRTTASANVTVRLIFQPTTRH